MLSRPLLSTFLTLLLLAAMAPAAAQTIEVRNGGTFEIKNGGVWDLEDSTTVDLGGTGATAHISETNGGRFANGPLTATRTLNAPNSRDVAGLGAVLTASQNLGVTTVTRGHVVQQAPNNNESIARFYNLSPSQNNSGLSAELAFSYADAELNNLSEGTLKLFKSTDGGQTWSEEGADGRSSSNNTVTLSGIHSFSRWTLGSTQSPLPVEMVSFEAWAQGKVVRLNWQIASETGNAGFRIQHLREGKWKKIGFVDGHGTTTEAQSYRYVTEALPVGTHQFRLKQLDLDGTPHLSDSITVEVHMNDLLRLRAPTPNPVRNEATLSFAVKETQEMTLQLFNVLGQRVATLYRGTPPAGETQTVRIRASHLSRLPSGVYFLRLRAGNRTRRERMTVLR